MKRSDQISAIFWIVVGIFVCYGSYYLGVGSASNPGSGFISFWCGIILSAIAGVLFCQSFSSKKIDFGERASETWKGTGWKKSTLVIFALVSYGLALPNLGFILSTIIFLLFLLKVIEPMKWSISFTVAIMASFITFFIFSRWIGIEFPKGFIEEMF